MRIFQNVHELIGNTPVVESSQFSLKQGVRLFAKLEYIKSRRKCKRPPRDRTAAGCLSKREAAKRRNGH